MTTLGRSKKTSGWALVLLGSNALAGCGAAVAPESLHTAQDEYKKAVGSAAPQLAPVQLDDAKQSLTRAEDAFKNGDPDLDIQDLSYIAQKRAEIAISAATREQARRDAEKAKVDKDSTQQALISSTQDKLSQTRAALQTEQQRLDEVEWSMAIETLESH